MTNKNETLLTDDGIGISDNAFLRNGVRLRSGDIAFCNNNIFFGYLATYYNDRAIDASVS